MFDALGEWFAEPGFSGCAFINVAGELAGNPMARTVAREHKLALAPPRQEGTGRCPTATSNAAAARSRVESSTGSGDE